MIGLLTFFIVLFISLIINRIATVALVSTGLSVETARFQARSAFSGVGYTTSESEKLVNHPIRRRILMILMIFGNAGIVTAISSLILAFVSKGDNNQTLAKFGTVLGGIGVLWFITKSRWFDRKITELISYYLKKYANFESKDYVSLMQLGGDYQVSELLIEEEDWLNGKSIGESKLGQEGVLILGLERGGEFFGVPAQNIRFQTSDRLVLYGREDSIRQLDHRRRGGEGDREHFMSRRVQRRVNEGQARTFTLVSDKDEDNQEEEKKLKEN